MSGGSVELPAGAGATVFEVERFAWTSDDRLEVTGRWFGVRGMRFVRPTLDIDGADGRRRLLAVLDHKPWAADEGQSWVAAFPWDGEPIDFAGAELAVTPSIAVRLEPPALPGAKRAPKPKPAAAPPAEPSELEQERDAALEARDAALRRVERVQQQSEATVEERVAPVREHFEREREAAREALARVAAAEEQRDEARRLAREALERAQSLVRERDEARAVAQAQRDARADLAQELDAASSGAEAELLRERDEAREAARAQRDARAGLARQLEEARAGLARAEASQANLVRERDDARRERDAAVQARDRVPVHHDTLVSDLASALRERDAARHQLNEALTALQGAEADRARDAALAEAPAPAVAPSAPVVTRRQEARHAAWGPRVLAFGALVVLIVVLWSLLDGVI